MFKKKNLGWFICILLALIPFFIWATLIPFQFRWTHPTIILRSLGQITGILGMSTYAVSLSLSVRTRWLGKYFGGLNRQYTAHHIFGGVAFILLLLHPVFLAAARLDISWQAAASLFVLGTNWAQNFGILGLLFLMILLVLTYYVQLPYQLWKFTHKFLGLAFLMGLLHYITVPGESRSSSLLRWYMILLSIGGLAIYIYWTILGKFIVPKYRYRVQDVKLLNDQVTEIDLIPLGKPMKYIPGQYIFISFEDHFIQHESHPFSLSSSPAENELKITSKSLGDYTSHLAALEPGTIAEIEGPYGIFSHTLYTDSDQIWVAGGIGITPFVSMARSLSPAITKQIDLYYSVNESKEAVYLDELNQIAQKIETFRVFVTYANQDGFLTANSIREASDLTNKQILLCGPPVMIHSLRKQLLELQVSADHIHSEEFNFL